jgi:hypothetical protein
MPFSFVRMQNDHGVWEEVAVHEVIARTFLGYRPGSGQIVRHRNPNDTLNNAVDNLYVISPYHVHGGSRNAQHSAVTPRKQTQSLVQFMLHPLRVLNHFPSLAHAETETGISKSRIKQVCHGGDPNKLSYGFYFCYAEFFDEVVQLYGSPVNI